MARKKTFQAQSLITTYDALKELGITQWDIVLLGDGSGCDYAGDAGWACMLLDRASQGRKLFYGGMSPGTVTLGEIYPYLHAMLWLTHPKGIGSTRLRNKPGKDHNLDVYVLTDSQTVVNSMVRPGGRQKHRALWAMMDSFTESHYRLHFRHISRNRIYEHVILDQVARRARLDLADVWTRAMTDLGLPASTTLYGLSTPSNITTEA